MAGGPMSSKSAIEGGVQSPGPLRRDRLDLLMLVAASILLALPFVVLHHVNTIDGPAHVLGGRILEKLGSTPVVRHFYTISFTIAPNVLTQLLLTALMAVVSPTLAEKVLVVVYIVALPLAVRFAIRQVSPGAGWLALLSLPFVVSYTFLFGFYDFSYAMVGAMIAIGLAIRHRGKWTPSSCAGLALVLLLTYASHIVPLVMAVVVIATIVVADVIGERHDRRTADPSRFVATIRQSVLPPVLAIVPVLALTIAFVASGEDGPLAMQRLPLGHLVRGLITLTTPIVSYSHVESITAFVTAGVLVVLVATAISGFRTSPPSRLTIILATALMVCVLVYFASPDTLGTGSYLNERLSLFPPLMLLLACASVPASARLWRTAGIIGLGAALVAMGSRLPTMEKYDRLTTEYLTVERAIPPGVTLLALKYSVFGPSGPLPTERTFGEDPLTHEVSRVAADRGDVDLRHLEARVAYYPEQFRPRLNQLGNAYINTSQIPPEVNILEYNRLSGRAVQYVLVVGLNSASAQVLDDPATRAVERQLAQDYVRIMVTKPTGLVELYRHR